MIGVIPNSFGVRFREFNPNHVPAGSPEGGEFAADVKAVSSLDFNALGVEHQFLYDPQTDKIVVSPEYPRHSHAELFAEAKTGGDFDSQIRGWIYHGDLDRPEGKISFYYTPAWRLPGGQPRFSGARDDEADIGVILDNYMKAAQFFIRNGASKDTEIGGLDAILPEWAHQFPNGTTLGGVFPDLFPKRRREVS